MLLPSIDYICCIVRLPDLDGFVADLNDSIDCWLLRLEQITYISKGFSFHFATMLFCSGAAKILLERP